MKHNILDRFETSLEGTFGKFVIPHANEVLWSVECPWLFNIPNVSCVPEGEYQCVFEFSEKFGRSLYELKDVPNRSECKFHIANFGGANWTIFSTKYRHDLKHKCDLNGCIGLGIDFGKIDGQNAVLRSDDAFVKLHGAMHGEPFKLTIRNCF